MSEGKRFSPDVLMTLYGPVGEIVIGWALAEQILDNCVALFFHAAGGRQIEPELPRMLKRKISFSRRCLNKLAPLADFRQQGTAFMDEIAILAELRHTLIHGALSDYDAATATYTFTRLDAVKDKHWIQPRTVSLPILLNTGGKCLDLGSRFGDFLKRLVEAFVPEDVIKKYPGPIGR